VYIASSRSSGDFMWGTMVNYELPIPPLPLLSSRFYIKLSVKRNRIQNDLVSIRWSADL